MKALLCGLSVGIMLASCSGGEEGSDKFRGDGMYETQREAVAVFGAAMCLYTQRCLQPELTDEYVPACINSLIDDICGNSDCELPPVASDAEVDACFDVTEASECAGVEGAFPMECEILFPEQSPPA